MCSNSVLGLTQGRFPTLSDSLQRLPRGSGTLSPGACTCRSGTSARGPRPPSWPRRPEAARTDCGCAAVGERGARRDLWVLPPPSLPGLFAQSLGWLAGHRLPQGMWQKPGSGTALPPPAEGEQNGQDGEPRPWPPPNAYSVQFLLVETGGRNSSHASKTVKHVIGDLKALHRKITSRAAEHRGTFLLPS